MINEIGYRALVKIIAIWLAATLIVTDFFGQLALLNQPIEWGEVKAKATVNGVAYALVVGIGDTDYAVQTAMTTYLYHRIGSTVPCIATADGYRILRTGGLIR